jgi:DNA-binding transcriptional ArsR family regulator
MFAPGTISSPVCSASVTPRILHADAAQALADPTRLTVAVALLEAVELCVCDLAWIVERAQNLVSHHVRVLRAQGIVRSRREGKMVMYSLTDGGRARLAAVLRPLGTDAKEHVGV